MDFHLNLEYLYIGLQQVVLSAGSLRRMRWLLKCSTNEEIVLSLSVSPQFRMKIREYIFIFRALYRVLGWDSVGWTDDSRCNT
jgi:hypothetical protein